MSLKTFYHDYKEVLIFSCCLITCVILSHVLSHHLPVPYFDTVFTPIINACVATVCLGGAVLIFRHTNGLRVRKAWGGTLLCWGLMEVSFLILTLHFHQPVLITGSIYMETFHMLAGNTLGWLLLIYPTSVLRPGWLNVKRSLIQLVPLWALCIVDYIVPLDLRWLIALYPIVLLGFLLMHIRAYRNWCEENYSTMDEIDEQWILRYLIMVIVIGASYMFICITTSPTRLFTQQILLLFFFAYSTEQILYRRDPWEEMKSTAEEDSSAEGDQAEYIRQLEQWMESEKPYRNTEFRLIDLRAVLPMNRTYLSQFISSAYGCNFYQFVTRYRIEEAKRLMTEHPDMKLQDVSEQSGFSSPTVFARIFTREVGETPSEWSKKIDAK